MVDRVSRDSLQVADPKTAMIATAAAPDKPESRKLPRRRPVRRHPGIYYRPRADGRVGPPYEISYVDSSGRRRWQVVHGSLEEAEARRAELRLRRRRGERIEPCRQLFEPYAYQWLERQDVRPRTRELYQWAINTHLVPFFGWWRLDQIGPDDIAGFVAHMCGKGLKGWTISSALRPLSVMLAQAARRGRIPVNPMTQLERGERPRHDDERPKRILTLEEMQTLIAATDGMQMRCLVELLLSTGMRIGEALGLTVGDLDFEGAIVRVECQLDRDGQRSQLKTAESRRAIDIPPRLMRRLRALLAARGALFTPQAFVFASRTGTGLERKVVRGALTRAIKKAKLAAPTPTLHDLRHSHASMLIALDYSVVEVQHRLGHRKPDTTLKIYSHQWKYRDAQHSRIGNHIGHLLQTGRQPLQPGRMLALPAATSSTQPG